jgi:uncharacterized protein YggE
MISLPPVYQFKSFIMTQNRQFYNTLCYILRWCITKEELTMPAFRHKLPGLIALIAAVVVSFSTASAQDTPPPQRTISVTGTGTANGSPDIAYIELGVQIRNSDIGAAVEQSNTTMEAVMAAVSELGIPPEDIQTTQFNVWQDQPVDPATGMPSDQTSYIVTNMVQIKVRQIDQISDVIQTALDAGANQVFGLTFGMDDPSALEATAREQAVADARTRAEALAAAFGVTLGDPISITEGFLSGPGPVFAAAEGLGGGGPSISSGQLSVQIQVSVTFAIGP